MKLTPSVHVVNYYVPFLEFYIYYLIPKTTLWIGNIIIAVL